MSSLNCKHIHLLDSSHWPSFHLFKVSFTLKNGMEGESPHHTLKVLVELLKTHSAVGQKPLLSICTRRRDWPLVVDTAHSQSDLGSLSSASPEAVPVFPCFKCFHFAGRCPSVSREATSAHAFPFLLLVCRYIFSS